MRDLFYTVVIVWIVWRILKSVSNHRAKSAGPQQNARKKEGKTTVDFVPPKKKNVGDVEGEYVDFEEIKEDKS